MTQPESPVESIFFAALAKGSPAERAGYLDEACGNDHEMRERVERLLKALPRIGNFLEADTSAPMRTGVEPTVREGPGSVIGPYKLLQQIGEGGMGIVFMAEQTQPVQRKVAIKIIKPGMDSRQFIARFEAERQALALMDHVNISRVLDAGTIGASLPPEPAPDLSSDRPDPNPGRPYFVMELVHGVPITRFCDENHLTLRERLELFVPVCQAIQHAHQKGIIHRDIKPSNVLVTLYDGKPVPKVIDFGVAKATEQKLTERTLFTQYGTMVGTLEYMSPEQAEMSALGVDTRSDIYSLGVLLYELLTGSTPLSRERVREAAYGEVLRMIKEEEAPRPSTRLSDCGDALMFISAGRKTEPSKLSKLMRGELDWIVMKTLEKDRNRRYDTAGSLAIDVGRYLNHEAVQACPPSTWYRFRKFARRNRAALATAGLVVAALMVVAVVTSLSAAWLRIERDATRDQLHLTEEAERKARHAEQTARHRLYDARVAQAKASRGSGRAGQRFATLQALTEAAQLLPGLKLGPEEEARAVLELRNEAIAAMTLTDLRSAIPSWEGMPPKSRRFAFDADLQRYARINEQGAITIRQIGDDKELFQLAAYGKPVSDLQFSPDGHYLAAWDGSHRQVWDLSRREVILETEDAHGTPTFTHDSRHVAFGHKDGTIRLHELPSGAEAKRLQAGLAPIYLRFDSKGAKLAVCATEGKTIRIVTVDTGKEDLELTHTDEEQRIVALAWHPEGRLVATSGFQRIYFWDTHPRPPKLLNVLKGPQARVSSLTFSHGGQILMSNGYDGVLRLWDPWAGRQLVSMATSGPAQFSLDDRHMPHCYGTRLGILEVALGRECRPVNSRSGLPIVGSTPEFSPDGRLLAIGDREGVRLWDLAGGVEVDGLPIGYIQSLGFDRTTGELLTSADTGLQRWPVARVQGSLSLKIGPPRSITFPDHHKPGRAALSLDGRTLAVSVGDSRGRLGDQAVVLHADRPTESVLLAKHPGLWSVALSPDGRWAATGPWDGPRISVWDTLSGNHLDLPGTETATCRARATFSPDGTWLVTATEKEFRFWKVGTWEPGLRIARDDDGYLPGSAAFSPDGTVLAATVSQRLLKLLDTRTGAELATLSWPDLELQHSPSFSSDGSQLAVADEGKQPNHVWDLRLIRGQLKAMGLDWDLPPYPPSPTDEASRPVRVTVDLGPVAAERHYQQGCSFARARQWDKAIKEYSRAIEQAPEDGRYWLGRARACVQLKQWSRGIDDFTEAIARKPDEAAASAGNHLAWLLATCPDPEVRDAGRAVERARKAVELAPSQANFWNTLGVAHYRAGDWKSAISALHKSAELGKGPNALDGFSLAMAYRQLGKKDQARACYGQAVLWMEKHQPNSPELRRFRGEAEELLGVEGTP